MKRFVAALTLVLLPLAGLAQEIEETHHHPGIPWVKLAFTCFNFAIFAAVLYRFAGPAIRAWVSERHSTVQSALEQAARVRREADALRAEWQQRIDKLAGELEAMLNQARQDINAERDQILAAARRAAEAIQRDAERTAENELRQARERLQAEVAAQALAIAERLAPQRLTGADQGRFIDEFVSQVRR
jgi:F-type H+-transporting ATPase subunit b